MFTIDPDPQFTEDVAVPTPTADGWTTQTLRTRFRMLPQAEIEALHEAGGIEAVANRLVVRFHDLADSAGQPLDGAGEWRGKLLAYECVRLALLSGYRKAVLRVGLGNFGPGVAPGQTVN